MTARLRAEDRRCSAANFVVAAADGGTRAARTSARTASRHFASPADAGLHGTSPLTSPTRNAFSRQLLGRRAVGLRPAAAACPAPQLILEAVDVILRREPIRRAGCSRRADRARCCCTGCASGGERAASDGRRNRVASACTCRGDRAVGYRRQMLHPLRVSSLLFRRSRLDAHAAGVAHAVGRLGQQQRPRRIVAIHERRQRQAERLNLVGRSRSRPENAAACADATPSRCDSRCTSPPRRPDTPCAERRRSRRRRSDAAAPRRSTTQPSANSGVERETTETRTTRTVHVFPRYTPPAVSSTHERRSVPAASPTRRTLDGCCCPERRHASGVTFVSRQYSRFRFGSFASCCSV